MDYTNFEDFNSPAGGVELSDTLSSWRKKTNGIVVEVDSLKSTVDTLGAPLVVKGPGIDPTGATPSSDGLNTFFAANKRGEFYIPEGFYWINKAVKLYESANYRGAGSTPYQPGGHTPAGDSPTAPSGTVFFAKDTAEYPFVPYNDVTTAVDTANGVRTMFISETWTEDDAGRWMHNFAFSNCGIDGNQVADYGFKIYQMGEVGHITDCTITDCRQACVFAAGSHAPFTMRNCTINGPGEFEASPATDPKTYVNTYPYTGLHFGKHPTLGGSSGEVRLIGLSGDRNNGGILRISGGHHVTAFGSKFENNSFKTILFDQQGRGGLIGKGGGAASLALVGGYSQDPTSQYKTSEEIIRIEEGVTPSITMNNFNFTQGVISSSDITGSHETQFYDSTGNYYTPALIRNIGERFHAGNGSITDFPTVFSDVDVYLNNESTPQATSTFTVITTPTNPPVLAVSFNTAPANGVPIYLRSKGTLISTMNSIGSIRQPFFSYGPGMNTFHSNIQLGKGNSLYATGYSAGAPVKSIISLRSDNILGLKAAYSQGIALFPNNSGNKAIHINNLGIGFNDTAPIAKPTINGSATSTARIQDILTALHNYGLITFNTP